MPIYEYRCEECGTVFDKFVRSVARDFEVECPQCHSDKCKKNICCFASTSTSGTSLPAPSCATSG